VDHPNAGQPVIQDRSSDHRFKRLHLTRASVRRASGFVLTSNPEVIRPKARRGDQARWPQISRLDAFDLLSVQCQAAAVCVFLSFFGLGIFASNYRERMGVSWLRGQNG
jgi:hypothetical protein